MIAHLHGLNCTARYSITWVRCEALPFPLGNPHTPFHANGICYNWISACFQAVWNRVWIDRASWVLPWALRLCANPYNDQPFSG